MIIRCAELVDYESINRLYNQLHKEHVANRPDYYKHTEEVFSKDDLDKYISSDRMEFFVAVNDANKVFGFIEYEIREDEESEVLQQRSVIYLNALVTDINYRNRGIAGELFRYALADGRKHNIDAIELNVWKFNTEAIRFYESLGMEIKSIRYELEIKD